jgi:polyhydroxybutyrate depolymerase
VIKKCIENLEENLFVMVKELTPETTGNWCPYRDLIQRQMIHPMRIVVLLFSGVFLWVTLVDAVPASVVSSGRAEAKLDGELYLYEKNPSSGSIVPGGAWGKMSYAREGPAFEFVFSGYRLRPGVSYTLMYFPDPWPAEGLISLATATGDSDGRIQVRGLVPIAHLPAKYDANYPAGAKIRLVLSDDIDWGKGGSMARKRMRRWKPTQYLLEAQLINFSISRGGCNAPGHKSGTFPRKRIFSGGIDRQYDLLVPSSYTPGKPAPLVFNFHGFTADPETQDWLSGMSRLAEEAGFILATPKGTGNEEVLGWNAGECCGQAASENVDDVAFTSDMIDRISAEYCVDPFRIYATGMSNGAFMSYRLACELAGRIAAIGIVAGVTVVDSCLPSRPVPVISFNGTADLLVWYDGGIYESVPRTIARWSMRNGCSREMETVYKKGNVRCEAYRKCKGGATVELCTIYGGGHSWPGGMDISLLATPTFVLGGDTTRDIIASRAIWEFFQKHPMPQAYLR